jgi:hypothetical protein
MATVVALWRVASEWWRIPGGVPRQDKLGQDRRMQMLGCRLVEDTKRVGGRLRWFRVLAQICVAKKA